MLSRTGAEENMTSGQIHGSLETVKRTFCLSFCDLLKVVPHKALILLKI
jgi:hypothetical protein